MPYGRDVMQEDDAAKEIGIAVERHRKQEPEFPWVMVKIFLLEYLTWEETRASESVLLFHDIAENWRWIIVRSLFNNLHNAHDAISAMSLLFGDDSMLNAIVDKANVLANEISPRKRIV